jgi:FixJ family two-component response regulator/tetratricopeptide (TPR) repeat protein
MKSAGKVLIVDDDKSSGQLLAEVVKRMGFKPIVASKATDALNVVKLQSINAAIVDVMLPKMSGVDLVQEFRTTKFGDAPVVFVSGIFKDKAFAGEALRKTGGVEFLFKPFGADELMEALKRSFAVLLASEQWTVHTLLTKKLASERERVKAIENLDKIKGQDFPFVLGILMDSGASGHLNIVADDGEIFGVTLSKGTISEVDSAESLSTSVLTLIAQGYMNQEDWDGFQLQHKRRISLERLVESGLISPHAVSVAKHEQILFDLKTLCSTSTIQINFVTQDEADEPPKHAVHISELLGILRSSFEEIFTLEYLKEFFEPLKEAPIQVHRPPEEIALFLAGTPFERLRGIANRLSAGITPSAMIAAYSDQESLVYQCLHYLVLSRAALFQDVKGERSRQSEIERYKELYEELKARSPDKVFEYFGAPERAQITTIKNIYDTYVRSNNPSSLPKSSPPELLEYCGKCMVLIQSAYEVMNDEKKRAELFEQLKRNSEANRKRSNELTAQGYDVLRKGHFQRAVELLRDAERVQPTARQYLILLWAQIKAGVLTAKPDLLEALKRLDKLSVEDKKSAFYFMAIGLVKKQLGDVSAITFFERALEADGNFNEARRELTAMQNSKESKDKKLDFLHGDITEIVSQLFRRKSN